MTVSEQAVETAIRAGCNAAEVHLMCSYPLCKCKQMPVAIKMAIDTAVALMGVEQTELEKARALNLVLSEAVVIHDSYGVQGSDFDTCLVCQAGGAPGIPFKHAADCPVGRAEESANQWCREHQEEVTELEAEIANLKAIYALPAQSGSVQCREDVARQISAANRQWRDAEQADEVAHRKWCAGMGEGPRPERQAKSRDSYIVDAVLALKPAGQPVEGMLADVRKALSDYSADLADSEHNPDAPGDFAISALKKIERALLSAESGNG